MSDPKPTAGVRQIYKFHWHVLFTHFPVSFLMVAFGFHLLDILFAPPRFGLATDIVFIAAMGVMAPAALTGWHTWKTAYKGAKIMLFQRKIAFGWAMFAIGLPLAAWRTVYLINGIDDQGPSHWLYLLGNGALIGGAIVEGYYGGRLSHR
jgi:hypothetical protein